jgi:hypothetical protein
VKETVVENVIVRETMVENGNTDIANETDGHHDDKIMRGVKGGNYCNVRKELFSLFIHKMLAPITPSLVLMKDYQSYEIFPLIYNSFLTLQ